MSRHYDELLRYVSDGEVETEVVILETGGKMTSNKAAARDANVVSTVRGGHMFCNFDGRQQLAGWAPVSRRPLLRLDAAFE